MVNSTDRAEFPKRSETRALVWLLNKWCLSITTPRSLTAATGGQGLNLGKQERVLAFFLTFVKCQKHRTLFYPGLSTDGYHSTMRLHVANQVEEPQGRHQYLC